MSIENNVAVLRGPKGRLEMHKINHLPELPPLAKQMRLSAPQPNYPLAARQNRIQGSGIFKLVLVKDGRVDSIQVIKSTGSKLLDDAAENALRQWRFEPGLVKEISVPVRFTIGWHGTPSDGWHCRNTKRKGSEFEEVSPQYGDFPACEEKPSENTSATNIAKLLRPLLAL